ARCFKRLYGDQRAFTVSPFRAMLSRFLKRASEFPGTALRNSSLCEQIAVAQHFGIPTPLLDWSHSPYVAAYFAVANSPLVKNGFVNFCVHALNIRTAPQLDVPCEVGNSLLDDESAPFLYIDTRFFLSRRITRQAGCFTYHRFSEGLAEWLEKDKYRI